MDKVSDTLESEGTSDDLGKEDEAMRGYYTTAGFYGMVDGRYMLFASESEYYDCMEDE